MHWLGKLTIVLAVIVGLVVGGLLAVGWYLSPQSSLQKADAIVAISGGETSERAAMAIQLYQDGWAPAVVFSGAAEDKGGPSNARIMKRQALAAGVPASAIYLDETSVDTQSNAREVGKITADQHWSRLILVTSPYHQRRAALDFHYVLPGITIVNHSTIDHAWRRSNWWASPYSLALTLSELQKTIFVLLHHPAAQA